MSRFQKWFFVISLFAKLLISAITPISADESYYWVWSKNLQLSYFDHPGMIAWLLKMGEPLEQFGNAVKWPAVLMGQATLIVWYFILKKWVGERSLNYFLVLSLFAPLTGFGSMVVTPDLPVLFFWSLSLLFLIQLLESGSHRDAILLGVSLGLGFCSKYHIVLFVPSAILYLSFERAWKKVPWRSVLLILIFGLIFSAPVILWNYQTDFLSFKFQLQHGFSRPSWLPFWSYSYVIGQCLLIFPIPLYLITKARIQGPARILIYFSAFPLLFFFLSSFKALVEMNWPIVAYPSIYALAAIGAKSWRPILWSAGVWTTLYLGVALLLLFPGYIDPPNKIKELTQYDGIIQTMDDYHPLFAETYQMASTIWYKTKKPFYKLHEMSRRDFFDGLSGSYQTSKLFFLAMDKDGSLPDWLALGPYKAKIVKQIDDTFMILQIEEK